MDRQSMVLLLSGGIDSPVAGYMVGRQNVELMVLSGLINPEGEERHIQKIIKLVESLSISIGNNISLYVFEQRNALTRFAKSSQPKLTCVLCKRTMLKVAEQFCKRVGANAIIMGDSLGQVASQTLQNLMVIEEAISVPIIRPLIGIDKNEIVDFARKIGTYEISIEMSPTCAFVPSRPAIKARLEDVKKVESEIDIETIVEDITRSIRQVEISLNSRGASS